MGQQATLQVWPDLKAAPTKAALYRSKAAAIKATESTLRAIATVMDIAVHASAPFKIGSAIGVLITDRSQELCGDG
jgi:hypothetical protein